MDGSKNKVDTRLGQNLVMQKWMARQLQRTIRLSNGESMGMDHKTLLSGGLLDRVRLKDLQILVRFPYKVQ